MRGYQNHWQVCNLKVFEQDLTSIMYSVCNDVSGKYFFFVKPIFSFPISMWHWIHKCFQAYTADTQALPFSYLAWIKQALYHHQREGSNYCRSNWDHWRESLLHLGLDVASSFNPQRISGINFFYRNQDQDGIAFLMIGEEQHV